MARTSKTAINANGIVVESTTDGIRDMFKSAAATFAKTPSAKNYNATMGLARDFQSAYVADFISQENPGDTSVKQSTNPHAGVDGIVTLALPLK